MYFEEILLPAHRNFEKQNTVLEPSIIIINYCIVIIIILKILNIEISTSRNLCEII